MNRRDFGKLALGGVGAALAGCAIPEERVIADSARCAREPDVSPILRIDMHCHLLNHKDANGAAFVNRRFVQSEEPSLIKSLITGVLTNLSTWGSDLTLDSVKTEADFLKLIRHHPLTRETFCHRANERQRGFIFSNDSLEEDPLPVGSGRVFGFTSHRMRNAALMMALWPEIDIFMPSMVDFFETSLAGLFGIDGESPLKQAHFYRELHLTTRGRFMPLVSFHPGRSRNNDQLDGMTQLEFVEKAITQWGFIGVKVHPSSGFNPFKNEEFGCPNQDTLQRVLNRKDRFTEAEGREYDDAMAGLYRLCRKLDVPILTHNSDGLGAVPGCMQPLRDQDGNRVEENDWTNAPTHWIKAIAEANEDTASDARARVCLAHFAARFVDMRRNRRGLYPTTTYNDGWSPPPAEYDPPKSDQLDPSDWLTEASEHIREHEKGDIWLDLSHMTGLIYSSAELFPTAKVRPTSPSAKKYRDNARYARAFTRFMADNLHLHDRTMYGTDYHMPDVSSIGPQYRHLMERILPKVARERIMGINAVRYFGLAEGDTNRERLLRFYERNGISLDEITWTRRIDDRIATEEIERAILLRDAGSGDLRHRMMDTFVGART